MTTDTAVPVSCASLGDPGAARAIAQHLSRMADGLCVASRIGDTGGTGWSGPAANACFTLLSVQPDRFRTAAQAMGSTAQAMSVHSDVLVEAETLLRRAVMTEADSPEVARVLVTHARAISSTSAKRTVSQISAAAQSAPRAAGRETRLATVNRWRAELQLGAAEATQGITSLMIRFNQMRFLGDPSGAASDTADAMTAVAAAVRHPVDTIQQAVDWDSWRSNPVRAVGHLLPDLLAALVTGGAAAATRSAQITSRLRTRTAEALAADRARREQARTLAEAARHRLVTASVEDPPPEPSATEWIGEGGLRMPAEKAAAADAYWRFTAQVEPVITRQMHVTVADIGGRLVGLEHRLKHMDSLKRKLVTREQRTGESLTTLLFGSDDAMRYTIVIDDASYVRGVAQAVAELERSGLHTADISNAWHSGRYRGINTSWLDPRSGAAFEVQFHTPKSWEITKLTHPWYEEMRLPTTPPERRQELEARIAAEYQRAERPGDVARLDRDSLPPATPPAPIELPTDLTAPAAAIGAGAGVLVDGGQDKMATSDGGGRVDDGGGGDMDHRRDPATDPPVLTRKGTGQPP